LASSIDGICVRPVFLSSVRRVVSEQRILYAVCVLCARCVADCTLSGGVGGGSQGRIYAWAK